MTLSFVTQESTPVFNFSLLLQLDNHSSFNVTKVYYRWFLFLWRITDAEIYLGPGFFGSFFPPCSCSGVPLHLSRGWTLHYIHHGWSVSIFCSCRSFPIGKKKSFQGRRLQNRPWPWYYLWPLCLGIVFHHFFVLCFALLFVHITVSAPQETFCRICCLVIVTFMEISLNFKRKNIFH